MSLNGKVSEFNTICTSLGSVYIYLYMRMYNLTFHDMRLENTKFNICFIPIEIFLKQLTMWTIMKFIYHILCFLKYMKNQCKAPLSIPNNPRKPICREYLFTIHFQGRVICLLHNFEESLLVPLWMLHPYLDHARYNVIYHTCIINVWITVIVESSQVTMLTEVTTDQFSYYPSRILGT